MTFKHIIQETCSVAVGPLEYCGNVRVIHKGGIGGGFRHVLYASMFIPCHSFVKSLSLCRGDPTLPAYLANRELRGMNRKKVGADRKGKQKVALTKAQRLKRNIVHVDTGPCTATDEPQTQPEDRPLKRQRKSADMKIALQDVENMRT